MDPVTHGLAGVVIRNLGFKKKAALGVLILASVAPDFDYITRFWGADVFLRYHRGITHGVLALVVVPLIIGVFFGLKRGFFYYSFISFLGYGAHILLDLTNQYGIRLFSPLDWLQYSLDLTFIVDPYVSIGLLLSIVFSRLNKNKAKTIAFATLILVFSYMGVRYFFHEKTEDFLRNELDEYICKVCPLPNDFLRWWFVAKSGDSVKVGFADLFTKKVYIHETYVQKINPFIERSKQDRVVKSFLEFARYPYAEVQKQDGKEVVVWKELSYSFLPGEHFTARVVMDKRGNVLSSDFKF
jgi:inner membrane protein